SIPAGGDVELAVDDTATRVVAGHIHRSNLRPGVLVRVVDFDFVADHTGAVSAGDIDLVFDDRHRRRVAVLEDHGRYLVPGVLRRVVGEPLVGSPAEGIEDPGRHGSGVMIRRDRQRGETTPRVLVGVVRLDRVG